MSQPEGFSIGSPKSKVQSPMKCEPEASVRVIEPALPIVRMPLAVHDGKNPDALPLLMELIIDRYSREIV